MLKHSEIFFTMKITFFCHIKKGGHILLQIILQVKLHGKQESGKYEYLG